MFWQINDVFRDDIALGYTTMPRERTTSDVMLTLQDDYERTYIEVLVLADELHRKSTKRLRKEYEFHARQFVRAVFAYIEAVTFSLKARSAWHCIKKKIGITPEERYFATDIEYQIDDKGSVVEGVAKIPLAKNIRFGISLARRAYGVGEPFDASSSWWSSMKASIKVRDRLTHPKWPDDLDISETEVATMWEALTGFQAELTSYPKK